MLIAVADTLGLVECRAFGGVKGKKDPHHALVIVGGKSVALPRLVLAPLMEA